jgi:DNA-binding transcriptional regulator YhcF (GntR family)
MRIRLDPAAREPLSAQLHDALAARIRRGSLLPGERLPTVRDLARELDLAPNTVAKAYRELEAAGHLRTGGRLGTFVADRLPSVPSDADVALEHAADRYARRARQLGASDEDTVAAVRRALRADPA